MITSILWEAGVQSHPIVTFSCKVPKEFLFLYEYHLFIVEFSGAGLWANFEWSKQPERRYGGQQLQENPHHPHTGDGDDHVYGGGGLTGQKVVMEIDRIYNTSIVL